MGESRRASHLDRGKRIRIAAWPGSLELGECPNEWSSLRARFGEHRSGVDACGAAAQDAGAPATAPAAVAPAGQPLSESGRVPTPSEPAATPAEAAAVAGAAALSGAPAAPSAGTSETGAAPAAIASEQTAAPDPLASLDPADRAVAEKIRDLLAAKSDKIFANKRERA